MLLFLISLLSDSGSSAGGEIRKRAVKTHRTELLEGDPAVSVFVSIQDGFVDNLLQLRVLQVAAHHHLKDLEEFSVGDVAILVYVIDPEGN